MNQLKLRKFDLEAALAGKSVVTRDGRVVEGVAATTSRVDYCVVATIDSSAVTFSAEGRFAVGGGDHRNDLFMAPTERVVWVNLYQDRFGCHEATWHESQQGADAVAFDMGRLRIGGKAHPITIEE